jgi:hypothetical protein
MADNIGYTPGAGAKVAARDVTYSGEAALAQAVGLVTLTGADDAKTATDVSDVNPLPVAAYGELVEVLEAIRFGIAALNHSIGAALPGVAGFPIMEARQATAANLNATVAGSLTTLATLTNQAQIGGFAANDQIPSLMHMQADNLRRNIVVT